MEYTTPNWKSTAFFVDSRILAHVLEKQLDFPEESVYNAVTVYCDIGGRSRG